MLVHIAFGVVGQQGHANTAAQMFDGMPTAAETLTSDTKTTAAASTTRRQPVAFRIISDTAGYASWGPTATVDSSSGARVYIAANVPEYFGCNHGDVVDWTTA